MKLIVLGSSSSGNGYILQDSEGKCLLLEAGVKLKEVKKALDYNTRGLLGCLVTHRHGDHIGKAREYVDAGIDVYTDARNGLTGHRFKPIESKKEFTVGPWKVLPFDVVHDVPTFGFLLSHPESGKVCFITDTAYCKYSFSGLNNVIIEANYSREILMDRFIRGDIHAVVKDRVFKSHMSLESCIEFLQANDLGAVNKIVLIHLSSGNANPGIFRQKVKEQTGKAVEIAAPGHEVELTINPF